MRKHILALALSCLGFICLAGTNVCSSLRFWWYCDPDSGSPVRCYLIDVGKDFDLRNRTSSRYGPLLNGATVIVDRIALKVVTADTNGVILEDADRKVHTIRSIHDGVTANIVSNSYIRFTPDGGTQTPAHDGVPAAHEE